MKLASIMLYIHTTLILWRDFVLNILTVDDDREVLGALSKSLTRVGHNVTYFENARDALEYYKKNRFDVVITDIQMPEMNGVEFITKLHSYDKNVKILVITVLEDFEFVGSRIKENVYAYFDKPINFFGLIETLEKIESLLVKN